MSPSLSEVVEDRRFCIAVVLIAVTAFSLYVAVGIYQLYLTWQAALAEGLPITTDFREILEWLGLVVGFPLMILLIVGMYGYAVVLILRTRSA